MNALSDYRCAEFNLDELAATVRRFADALGLAGLDGRISPAPDSRTLRYYQTLGLLPRPLRYEGRQAIYGYQHLLHALAVKVLQTHGLSLAQIQRALVAADPRDIEAAVAEALASGRPIARSEPVVEQAFLASGWLPGPLPTASSKGSAPEPGAHRRPRPLTASEVAPGVWLVIDPLLVPNAEELLERIARIVEHQ